MSAALAFNLQTVKVKIEQAGGKYGVFRCPFCGWNVDYSFSASFAICDTCEAEFLSESAHFWDASKGEYGSAHWTRLTVNCFGRAA